MKHLGNASRKFNIICFGDQWDEYFRRRQQIMIKMSNYRVFDKIIYIELPLTILSFLKFLLGRSLPKVAQAWSRVLKHGLLCKDNGVWILTPITPLPYIPIKIVQGVNNFITYFLKLLFLKYYVRKLRLHNIILWITHPFGADFIGKLGEDMICYDRTEDFAYKHDCPSTLQSLMKKNDSKIIKRANIIFVQTKETLEKISTEKKNVFLVPNAVDIKWFDNEILDVPDIQAIHHPILGYCGNINSRIDFELLKHIAVRHPEWSIVIIGLLGQRVKELSMTEGFDNIHLIRVKPYKELPTYLSNFDVCLMPHKIDRFTESQSPLKLFNYLAAGKPVVSTNIAGVRDYKNIVKIGHTKEEFVSFIEEVLVNDSEEEVDERRAIAQKNTWDIRAKDIYEILKLKFM